MKQNVFPEKNANGVPMGMIGFFGDISLKDIPVGGYAETHSSWLFFKQTWWIHAPIKRTELVFGGETLVLK